MLNKTPSSPDQIFCPIRKEWVAAFPEEMVRQSLIHQMTQQGGYPISHLVLEKDLRQMPHLKERSVALPRRRTDLVCFGKGIHAHYDLYPLLVIECKAVKLTAATIRQIIGYNVYLQAHFIAIANQEEIRFGWYNQTLETFQIIPFIPSYLDLLKWAKAKTVYKN